MASKTAAPVAPLLDEDLAELFDAGLQSVLAVPARADAVELHSAPLARRDRFVTWRKDPLQPSAERPGWFEINLQELQLDDGDYEYEFLVKRPRENGPGMEEVIAADPYAEEITRFSGYRGVFHIKDGKRWRQPFYWGDEFPDGERLANNNKLVIYELPMRWTENAPEDRRQVALGTFEKAVFARLDEWKALGVNAIELLPVQDSADTLNWGYGTRFFFAPDLDMGGPVDLKYFVKKCHQRGIRVIFDVVMNHARLCPLKDLDHDSYFLDRPGDEPGRGDDYGGDMFRYRSRGADGTFAAREFQYRMAEFLIRECHADGFRIDEFRGIDHWEFIQEFRDRAWSAHQAQFPGRPFLVIAEDSWRRAVITHDAPQNPRGRKVTDSMWNFAHRDELRRAMRDHLKTAWGQPSRRDRIAWAVAGTAVWDDWNKSAQPGFDDLSQAVNYLTSHDVEGEHEKRILNYLLEPILRWYGRPDNLEHIRWIADHVQDRHGDGRYVVDDVDRVAHGEALERVRSAFALSMTSVGIPMILAGEELGDVHDLDHRDWRLKMSDPVDWSRRDKSDNNRALWNNVRELVEMRTTEPALGRNEIDFFYWHPAFNENEGDAVFAFCRTGGAALGTARQVVTVANLGRRGYGEFHLPWAWRDASRTREIAPPTHRAPLELTGPDWAKLSLAPFQVRVFVT